MTEDHEWTDTEIQRYADATGSTIEDARHQIAETKRRTFRSPYLGNVVSHGSDYELERAKGKHHAIERIRVTFPELFQRIVDGDGPVIRFQCPNHHHLAKVQMIVTGPERYPHWQLHTLDNVAQRDATEPGTFNSDGTRTCFHQNEPGGEFCGRTFRVESFGQRSCTEHGAEVHQVAALLSRGSFICPKKDCQKGQRTGKYDKAEELFGLYFLAAAAHSDYVTMDALERGRIVRRPTAPRR